MKNVVEKARLLAMKKLWFVNEVYSFGYNNLISDMRSLVIMRDTECSCSF